MTTRWLILADDLTGASDAGVAFAQRGCDTEVTWGDSSPPLDVQVHARDLASRASGAQDAASRHANALRRWLTAGQSLYKKMDSTLRGQPAAEIAALCATLHELGEPAWGVFAPANPAQKRTTRDGRVWVDGQPLENTDTWRREHSYADADLAAMLASAGLQPIKLPLDAVRGGSGALLTVFRAAASSAPGTMLVCDAETDDDLARIASAARAAAPGFYAGTAGLARALAAQAFPLRKREVELPATKHGTLVAVGSPAKVSREAAQRLAQHLGREPEWVRVRTDGTIDDPTQGFSTYHIAIQLKRGRDAVVLLETDSLDTTAVNPAFVENYAWALRHALSEAGAVIVTGGETAAALLQTIQVRGISLLDEIEPGLALGITRGDVEVPIVTKPGAFGDAQSLVRCLTRMRQLQRRE